MVQRALYQFFDVDDFMVMVRVAWEERFRVRYHSFGAGPDAIGDEPAVASGFARRHLRLV